MDDVLLRTWIAGMPRGYGGSTDWKETVRQHCGFDPGTLDGDQRVAITLDFRINPRSPTYRGKNLPHGTDLDNLVKETTDGLFRPDGRVKDNVIFRIEATKTIVDRDAECGVYVRIAVLSI